MLDSNLFWFVLENGINQLQAFLFFYFIMGYLTPKWRALEKHYWVLTLLSGLYLSFLNNIFTEPIIYFLLWLLSMFLILLFLFRGSFFWKISLLFCYPAIYLCTDIFTFQLLSSVPTLSVTEILTPSAIRLYGIILDNILYTVIIALIRLQISTRISSLKSPSKVLPYTFYIFILPLTSISIIAFNALLLLKIQAVTVLALFISILPFLINFIMLSQYRKLAMDISRSSSNQWLQQYLQQEGNKLNQLMSHYLRSNQLIHDLKNRLLPIQYALENHQLIEAETSLQSLMGNFPQLPVSHPQDTFPNKSNLIIKQNSPHFPSLTLRLEIVPPNYPIDPEISQLLTNWLEQVSRNASQTAANNPILMEGLLAAFGERIYLQIQLPVTLVKQCGKNFFRFHALRQRITEYKGFYYDDIVDDLLLITLTLPQKKKETVI